MPRLLQWLLVGCISLTLTAFGFWATYRIHVGGHNDGSFNANLRQVPRSESRKAMADPNEPPTIRLVSSDEPETAKPAPAPLASPLSAPPMPASPLSPTLSAETSPVASPTSAPPSVDNSPLNNPSPVTKSTPAPVDPVPTPSSSPIIQVSTPPTPVTGSTPAPGPLSAPPPGPAPISPVSDVVPAPAPPPPAPISATPPASPPVAPRPNVTDAAPPTVSAAPLAPIVWTLQIAIENGEVGRTKLHARTKSGVLFRITCDKLNVQTPNGAIEGSGSVKIDGPDMDGTCDRIRISWSEDRIVLEGLVNVKCRKDQQEIELTGDRLSVKVATSSTGKSKGVVIEKESSEESMEPASDEPKGKLRAAPGNREVPAPSPSSKPD